MNIWRGIGITFVAVLLAAFLAIAAAYFALDRSVLDTKKTEAALTHSQFYVIVRRDKFIPQLTEQITQKFSPSSALTTTDVIDSLRDAFPQDTVNSMTNTVIDATYAWLNKKSPDIDFSIPLTTERNTFIDALGKRVTTNLEKLPACTRYSQFSEDSNEITCIPPTATVEEVQGEIMDKVKEAVEQSDTAITPDTIGLDSKSLGSYDTAPDYLSLLWVANLVALPLAALLTLYLVVKRRSLGLIVIGITVLAIAVVCITAGQLLGTVALPSDSLTRTATGTMRPLIIDQLKLLAIWGGVASAFLIIGGVVWRKLAVRRASREHYVSHRDEE